MTRMPKLATGLALVGAVLALAACSKGRLQTGAAAAADGGVVAGSAGNASAGSAPAGAPAYGGPFEAHVVARMLSTRTSLVPLADGKVVLTTGFFRYELSADGTAKQLGELAAYAAKMPSDDGQLGGYDVEPIVSDEAVPGARPWHDLRGPSDGRRRLESWSLSDDIEVPADIRGDDLRRAADGTTVLVARDSKSESYVTFVAPPDSRHVTRVPIDGLDPARPGLTCEHVPSWGRPHLFCRSWRDGITSVHRLVGERWESIPIAEDDAKHLRVGAVGPDGALWLGLPAGSLRRIAASGAVETFDMPRADAALARASYWSMETYARPVSGAKTKLDDSVFGDGLRRWERIGITVGAAPQAISHIRQIVPRADGEAWVLASESHGANVLVHMSRPAMAPLAEPLVVGTDADQRNELRNLKEPVTWVAHCPQLFVTLAKQRADGSLASESVWSREQQIGAIVKKVVGKPRGAEAPNSTIVEGRLGGRRVAGVLVWRSEAAASEELLERAATTVASELSSMTGATPHITCTAPVLERASASLL